MAVRNYSSIALATTLTGGITNVATTIPVAATTGFPTAPFIGRIDSDTASEELVLVTAVVGLNLTVTRAYDATSGQAHNSGAAFRHSVAGIDLREPNVHVNASAGVHGLAGALVGTSDTQTLTNKTVTGGTVNPTTLQQGGVQAVTTTGVQTLTSKTLTSPTESDTVVNQSAAGTTGLKVHAAVSSTGDIFRIEDSSSSAFLRSYVSAGSFFQDVTGRVTATGLVVGSGTDVGAAWTAYTPTVTGWTLGNGTATGAYMQMGKGLIAFRARLTLGTTTVIAGTLAMTYPPAGISAATAAFIHGSYAVCAGGNYELHARLISGTTFGVFVIGTAGVLTSPTTTSPATWAAGNIIDVSGTGEAA